MNFLIVDDLTEKIDRITAVIRDAHLPDEPKISVVRTVVDAVSYLLEGTSVDLMILDLNLPIRRGEDIKEGAGLSIIRELKNRPGIAKPNYIIGLTAQHPIKPEVLKFFQDEGWALSSFDIMSTLWQEPIKNKIIYHRPSVTQLISKRKIVVVASAPHNLPSINLGTEMRVIETAIQSSSRRDHFEVISKSGGTFSIFTRAYINNCPEFLHLCGHGNDEGIAMETDDGRSEFVPTESLKTVISTIAGATKCLLLNSCYSGEQARRLSGPSLYVIGLRQSLVDNAAEHFVKGFYEIIGEGKDVPVAFRIGIARLQMAQPGQASNPQLWLDGNLIS